MATHETPSRERKVEPDNRSAKQSSDGGGDGDGKPTASRGAGPAVVAVVLLLALLPLLYVLSIGPVVGLFSRGYLQIGPDSPVARFYAPLEYIHGEVPLLAQPLDWYVELWRKDEPVSPNPPVQYYATPPTGPPTAIPAPAPSDHATPADSAPTTPPGDAASD